MIMGVSVRLKVGQFEVTTDTPEEAAGIIRLFDPALSAGPISSPKLVKKRRPVLLIWDYEHLKAFKGLLKEQPLQRALLNSLFYAREKGKLKELLVKELELDNAKQLAGPLSGLVKNAEKIGLAREAVYTMEKIQIEGKRTYRYLINDSLLSVLSGHSV